jgi:preprotein translocase subunit SecD
LPTAAASQTAPHRFRLLTVLATVPPLSSVTRSTPSTKALTEAVKSCDVAQVNAAVAGGAAVSTTATGAKTPTECSVLPVRNDERRLLVGPLAQNAVLGAPAGLSGRDIQSARPTGDSGNGNGVALTLTAAGSAKFNAMAATLFGRSAPRNEVAAVVDGVVYLAPAFQTTSFTGAVQLTGNFTARQATSLASTINASRRTG